MHSPLKLCAEAFHRRIIVAISSTAHAYEHAFLLQQHLIALARVGTPMSLRDGVTRPGDGAERLPFPELAQRAWHPESLP